MTWFLYKWSPGVRYIVTKNRPNFLGSSHFDWNSRNDFTDLFVDAGYFLQFFLKVCLSDVLSFFIYKVCREQGKIWPFKSANFWEGAGHPFFAPLMDFENSVKWILLSSIQVLVTWTGFWVCYFTDVVFHPFIASPWDFLDSLVLDSLFHYSLPARAQALTPLGVGTLMGLQRRQRARAQTSSCCRLRAWLVLLLLDFKLIQK